MPWPVGRPRFFSLETRKRISRSLKGNGLSSEHKEKISLGLKRYFQEHPEAVSKYFCRPGYNPNLDPSHRLKNSLRKRGSENPMWGRRGEKAPNWQGGKVAERKRIRGSYEYRVWRNSVFEKDDFTCQICGVKGGFLHADHIKPFAHFPLLRLSLLNGRTLCVPCHKKTFTYKARGYFPSSK